MESAFSKRMTNYASELRQLYSRLYPGSDTFELFCEMLQNAYLERSEDLRALDREREESPDWYRDQKNYGMLAYTQCFGGTLQGTREHLDYLRETGVNYLHLMPLLQSPPDRSDGGYAVADFRKVQPELGTMEDLAELTRACHLQKMVVCLDFVMNHTSEDHPWALRARQGEKAYQDRYFFYDSWEIPTQFERTVPQVFPTTAPGNFTWCEEAQKVVMTTFYPYQWDLNYANPTVLREMTADMLFLCNQGVDVIRLDATPYIWKELGTSCRNLPQVHDLVRLLRLSCQVVCPGTLLLGEIVMEPSKVVPYFGTVEKPECHMIYNVTTMATLWHTVATHDVRLLRHQLGTVFALPRQYTFLNYLRCHDDIGWGLDYPFLKQFGMEEVTHKRFLNDWFRGSFNSGARGELYNEDPRLGDARLCGTTASLCGVESASFEKDGEKLDKALSLDEMLHAFLLAQSGIPVLYSGDEIARENDYSYHLDPLKKADSRYLHRGNMNWEAAKNRTDPSTKEGRLYTAIRRLYDLRCAHRAFHADADTWILEPHNDQILGIGRYYQGEKLLLLFNFGNDVQVAWMDEGEGWTDLLTGRTRAAKNVFLPGGGYAWLKKDM